MANVLFIEDDVTLRQALAQHLARAGHTVRETGNGIDGLREQGRAGADVVVVDIFMPGQGGLQTIDQLRRAFPGVKIVAITGVATGALDAEGHALALGADRFLRKPFDAAALVAVVDELAGQLPSGP